MMKEQSIGHIYAAICVLIWGTTFVVSSALLTFLKPIELLMFRYILGILTLYIMKPSLFKWQGWHIEKYFMAAGFSGITMYYLFENIALTNTTASNVSIITSLAPFFTALLIGMFYREPANKYFYIGFIFAMVGIMMICMTDEGFVFHPFGDGFAIMAAFTWGFYSVSMNKIAKMTYSAIMYTRRIFLYGVIFMLPFAAAMKFRLSSIMLIMTPMRLAGVIFLSIISCSICFVLWNIAIQNIGAVTSSIYIYAIPVITIIFSVIFLHEKLTLMIVGGTILTMIGLIISGRKG